VSRPAAGLRTACATPGATGRRCTDDACALAAEIRRRAEELGLAVVGFAPARLPEQVRREYRAFVVAELAGDMDWLVREPDRREDPRNLWPEARTAICVGLDYGPERDPLPELGLRGRGYVSVYARGRDYHDVLKGRLKQLAQWLHRRTGAGVKVFVDTAPVLEKPLAEQAGIGWRGKHTNLVSRRFGSWLFLGGILTTLDLPHDAPESDHCGSCTRCIDVCPTGAIVAPRRLVPLRCISYLTIEHRGPIPPPLRPALGNRIYGCDDCLAVCPWNRFARSTREVKLQARPELVAPDLGELAALDEAGFRSLTRGSAIRRIGHARFLRNVLTAVGNSGLPDLLPAVEARLRDPQPLVRGAAVWALARLAPQLARATAREALAAERDPAVRAEWRAVLENRVPPADPTPAPRSTPTFAPADARTPRHESGSRGGTGDGGHDAASAR